jgi:hypothetical protein
MRFTALAVINVVSLTVGIAVAIYGGEAGYGYWALVSMTVTPPIITSPYSAVLTLWRCYNATRNHHPAKTGAIFKPRRSLWVRMGIPNI